MADTLLLISRLCMMALGVCCAYQGLYALLTLMKKPKWNPGKGENRYAVLVCARNEEAVLPQLLESIRAQDYPGGVDMYVAADNCTDGTAEAARQAGATVFERQNKQLVGKGYALDFLLKKIWALGKHYDGYFVFDADNLLRPDFVRRMDGVFGSECPVVTSYRNSKNYAGWIASGYALCFLREARYMNAPRMMLKTSCNVTGTGFVVSEEILKEAGGWPWHLLCEDLQFSVDQILAGRRIGYCPQAEFFDEQPTDYAASVKQRMRWCKGFLQVLGSRGGRMVKGALRGSWACADILLSYMPILLCTALSLCFAGLAALAAGSWSLLGLSVLQLIAGAYVSLLGMGILTGITEWKNLRATTAQKLASLVTFPLFMATYLPVGLMACFKKVEWAPIRHSAAVSIRQVAGTEKAA